MIIYQNTKGGFTNDVRNGMIASKVRNEFLRHNLANNNEAEFRAWQNSLMFMRNVLDDNDISDECNLAIEYQIPLTSKRVDFLIAGKDDNNNNNAVIVELKQWEDCETTSRPDVVLAFTGGAKRAVCHPSYQAYSYAKIIENFNKDVYENNIHLEPCAYLHNFKEANRPHIDNFYYKEAIENAPIFLSEDVINLRSFIKTYIKKKDGIDLLMKIDNGKLKPAKALQDAVASMIKGNTEFYLIDEQKIAYETVKKCVEKALKSKQNDKYVVVVKGGPGTGKSVIAVKLLCDLINKGLSANYVTKNRAPREVFFEKLKQDNYKLGFIKNLFKASDSFWNMPSNTLDCVIVDETHRLRKKSAIFHGENQIKELINCARVSVFFIDENQKVTTKDIGSIDEIYKWSKFYNVTLMPDDGPIELVSQFRCNGSDGYLNFLDDLLGIKKTANYQIIDDYDFKVFDDPSEMREALRRKNAINNKSRMLAGYCYEWKSETNQNLFDIEIGDTFKAKWNFANEIWAISPTSFDQVGCIHTSQGLEFDYVGVIIGKDLYYKDFQVRTNKYAEAMSDKSSGIRGCKDEKFADELIRNTYKTLLSRGQKGCYVYCEDKALSYYIKTRINTNENGSKFLYAADGDNKGHGITFKD